MPTFANSSSVNEHRQIAPRVLSALRSFTRVVCDSTLSRDSRNDVPMCCLADDVNQDDARNIFSFEDADFEVRTAFCPMAQRQRRRSLVSRALPNVCKGIG